MSDVNIKSALVTGGTKGIGRSICESLLNDGYFVISNYCNDDESANLTLKEFELIYPNRFKIIKMDLSTEDSILPFCNEVKQLVDTLDVIVFSAGKTDRTPFGEIEYNSFLSVYNTNLFIPFFIIQELYKIMNINSSVTMIGSLMGIHPHSVSISYGVSKSAVHSLVKNLVKFLSQYEIRVNAIAPGFVMTEWQSVKPKEIINKIENKIALKRFANSNEIADALLFVVNNKYMNGEIVTISGGYSFE